MILTLKQRVVLVDPVLPFPEQASTSRNTRYSSKGCQHQPPPAKSLRCTTVVASGQLCQTYRNGGQRPHTEHPTGRKTWRRGEKLKLNESYAELQRANEKIVSVGPVSDGRKYKISGIDLNCYSKYCWQTRQEFLSNINTRSSEHHVEGGQHCTEHSPLPVISCERDLENLTKKLINSHLKRQSLE